jgi:hypothetical protein
LGPLLVLAQALGLHVARDARLGSIGPEARAGAERSLALRAGLAEAAGLLAKPTRLGLLAKPTGLRLLAKPTGLGLLTKTTGLGLTKAAGLGLLTKTTGLGLTKTTGLLAKAAGLLAEAAGLGLTKTTGLLAKTAGLLAEPSGRRRLAKTAGLGGRRRPKRVRLRLLLPGGLARERQDPRQKRERRENYEPRNGSNCDLRLALHRPSSLLASWQELRRVPPRDAVKPRGSGCIIVPRRPETSVERRGPPGHIPEK